ncbi:MAG: hypothetical protein JXA04_12355 [Gammaproteobacteria bacterium]|nr:hypothetical protein [Gammaproteobacteria bacterium]
MKNQTCYLKIVAVCSVLFLTAVLAEDGGDEQGANCVRPEQVPAVPDGRRSTESEMKDAMVAVRDFLAANAQYRACVIALVDKSTESASENTIKAARRLIEESLETEELLGELFNQQVRIYKSINPDD